MEELSFYMIIASGLAWIYLAFFHHRFWHADQTLPETRGQMERWPPVVAIVPARNEEQVLPKALRSLADQNYPGFFDILVVNDNSSDGTAQAARSVMGVSVLEAEPLKPGWAGKLWALKQGLDLAGKKFPQAEFYWFTDADIRHGENVLKGLVEAAVLDNRNLVSQMVCLHCKSFWEKALVPAFIFFFEMLYPFPAVNSASSRTAGAAGGCLLIEKKWLQKIGGLERIKNALIDDCALAGAIKGAGGRIWLGLGLDSLSLRAYGLGDFWTTVARTAFTQLKNSALLLTGTVLALLVIFVSPPLSALENALAGDWNGFMIAASVWAMMVVIYAPSLKLYDLSPLRGVFLPLIALLYIAMTVHSALRHWRGSGGQWKDRSYNFGEERD